MNPNSNILVFALKCMVMSFYFFSVEAQQARDILAPVFTLGGSMNPSGYINEFGELAVQPIYGETREYLQGRAPYRKKDYWGYLRQPGLKAIEAQFSAVHHYREGIAAARMGMAVEGGWGYVDSSGLYVIKPKFLIAEDFHEGLAATCLHEGTIEGVWGFIDKSGKTVIEHQYTVAYDFHYGLARVNKGGLMGGNWGFVDHTGKQKIPLVYGGLGDFHEGLASVNLGKAQISGVGTRWGFMDTTGTIVIPGKYSEVKDFSENLAAVKFDGKQGGKWGFINREDKVVIPGVFKEVTNFCGGVAAYKENGQWGLIDATGTRITPPMVDEITFPFTYDLIPVRLDRKWGYINSKGKWIIDPEFWKAGIFTNPNKEGYELLK